MRDEDFLPSSPGSLVPTVQGAKAFVPAPLPLELSLSSRAIRLHGAAENAIGRLSGTAARVLNPFLVSGPLLRREAILSSRMEGTITTPEELLLFELGGSNAVQETRRDDNQEVANYITALNYGVERLKTFPLNLRFLREVHERLMSDVRGKDERPGEFRTTQNWIGTRRGDPVTEARFVPPPVDAMHDCLNRLEQFMNIEDTEDSMPLLVRLALIHYQFESIHPFRDGNGRIGRLLVPLVLQMNGRMPTPLLYVSSHLEQHKDEYVDLMLRVSHTGDWMRWVEFFLHAITASAEDSIQRSTRLIGLREQYRHDLQQRGVSARLLHAVDQLFIQPAMTIAGTAHTLGVSQPGAWNMIQKLLEQGIVQEATGRTRNKVFVARNIIEVIDAE